MKYETEDGVELRFKKVAASRTFSNILTILDLRSKSVLDIGCSYGEFLTHFGPGSTGVTIVSEEVSWGQEHGLDIRLGNIEDKDFKLEQKYDVIFANNIFEHLYSPHAFLRKISDYLNDNGVLILGVPCIPKISPLLKVKKFRGSLAGAHINFFTKETLEWTAVRGGWIPYMNRGFRFKNKFIDWLLEPIYPHFYVVARRVSDFKYSEKRLKELEGYEDVQV